jgi:salicylate hydroxylase
MFRFVLPRDVVESVTAGTEMAGLISKPELNLRIASDESKRSIVSYPCRNHELLNVGCIAPDKLIDLPVADSWSAPGDRKDLLRVFGDFAVRSLLEYVHA